jgi:Protease inhibitor Inh
MKFRSSVGASLVFIALGLAGCQSSRVGNYTAIDPLPAAPSGVVQQSQLPPPTKPTAPQVAATDPSQFPAAPTTAGGATASGAPGTQVASAAPSGPDLTVGGVAGVWNVNVAGQSCKVATPQTKYGQGFRAGPLRCPGEVANVKSWNVSGKQLTLYDESGSAVARLFSSGGAGFNGQTSGGSAISLTR